MPRTAFTLLVAGFVCISSLPAAAQSRISPAQSRSREENDSDKLLRHEQWFRRGRQGLQQKSAAALRLEAYRQMIARRNSNAAGRSVAQSSQTVSPLPAWSQIGPAPILSSPTGSLAANYDYGPVIGRVISLFVDPGDATGNTVFLGGATGGLWKSTNAASATPASIAWTPLIDNQPSLSVGAIGVQPGNSNLIILGTGEPDFSIDSYYSIGFLRSTDGGSTWSLISSANSGAGAFTMDLRGISFSSVVFSSDNPDLVVAGAGASGVGFGNRIETVTDQRFGTFYSTDAGQTWTRSAFYDGTNSVEPWSVSSVIYNPSEHLFFATVGFQGIYSSSNGANWYRLVNQPGSGLSISNCPTRFSTTCPMFRGALAIRSGADEMYVWYVDLNSKDQGIYKTANGGQTWTALNESGITNCGDAEGCGTDQGFFNLVLSAVPQTSGGTDLYAGAVNLFKCSITSTNPNCSASPFINLTHVYGCSPIGSLSHVHPDQHAIAFSAGSPRIIYFGNDGGIYRTLNGAALTSGACGGAMNPFDNLNATMGSMAQFVWLSEDPVNQTIVLGGTQDNGSPARISSSQSWPEVNLGDGGYNVINPGSSNEWFTAHTDVSIQRCTLGSSCTAANFSTVVTNSTVGGDAGPFYTPYLLDSQLPTNMLVGTCRLWRGPSSGVAGWTALSHNLDTQDGAVCSDNSQNQIQSLAAGGPTTSNGSQVIWVGTASGFVWRTFSADSGPSSWLTPFNTPYETPISSIVLDPKDPTGKTAYLTTLGFAGGQIEVIGSIITGAPTGDLPNIPANSLLFDPEFPNIMYVGTDISVFQSVNGGVNWTELGPGSLPSAPVSHMEVFRASGVKKLRASTYGRGVWEIALPTGAIPMVSFSNYTVTFPAQSIGTTSSPIVVTLTNIGSATLNLTGFSLTGSEFSQTNNCSSSLAQSASCTVNITFTPSPSGNHSATLSLADDANDSPQVVQLVGNIPTPAIRLVQSNVGFGNIAVGAVAGPEPAIFVSSGTGPLNVTGISITGDFSETDSCIGVLAINQQCTINVSFRPTSPGLRQGTILIADNASGSPHSISVAGTGVAELVASTDLVDFPNTLVGQSSAPQTVSLSNFTSSAIGIKQITLQGPNTSEFSQSNNCGTSVAPQSSCVVTLTFAPTVGDIGSTSLSVLDTNGNTVGALVQGAGNDFSVSSNTFPSTVTVTAGQPASFTVWVASQGSFAGNVSMFCTGGPTGGTCSASPPSVSLTQQAGGTSVTVSVTTTKAAVPAPFHFRYLAHRHYLVMLFALILSVVALLLLLVCQRLSALPKPSVVRSAFFLLVLGILMLAVSCGGSGSSSSPPPPPQPTTYIITVTGTSGSLTNSTTLTLIVNP